MSPFVAPLAIMAGAAALIAWGAARYHRQQMARALYACPALTPEDRIRAAFAGLAGRELSPVHASAVDYLIADVKRGAAQ